jgi:hypothetical protein
VYPIKWYASFKNLAVWDDAEVAESGSFKIESGRQGIPLTPAREASYSTMAISSKRKTRAELN